MSHFTVLVVLPKEGLEPYEGANEHTGEDEHRNAYNHQWFHPQLEETLEPYNEQPEDDSPYLETSYEVNERATEILNAYDKREWDSLAEIFEKAKSSTEEWERRAIIYDVKGGRKATESEIATKLEPYNELYSKMASETFSHKIREDWEQFQKLFGQSYSGELVIDSETNDVLDVFYQNPYAKWDWWVVGGRWRQMGNNGLFEDISVFAEEEMIPYWKEELGYFKLNDIENELQIDRKELTETEYDKVITEYLEDESNRIVHLWDTSEGTGDKAKPKSYYNNKDLLTMVSRRKESTWAILFPEEGWIEAGEMGWFGTSSLDILNLGETEEAMNDQLALTDNLIAKYKDTHIGLVVDCHI